MEDYGVWARFSIRKPLGYLFRTYILKSERSMQLSIFSVLQKFPSLDAPSSSIFISFFSSTQNIPPNCTNPFVCFTHPTFISYTFVCCWWVSWPNLGNNEKVCTPRMKMKIDGGRGIFIWWLVYSESDVPKINKFCRPKYELILMPKNK